MSGIDLIIQRMSDHDLTSMSQGVAKTIGPIVLAELDVSQYREGTLEVLIKSATIPLNASITIDVYAMARTDDDAGTMYIKSSQSIATVTIATTVSSATLSIAALTANFGAMVAVSYTGTVSTTSGTFKGTFETRLCLKN